MRDLEGWGSVGALVERRGVGSLGGGDGQGERGGGVGVGLGAGSLDVLTVVEVLCPTRPGVALLAPRDVGEGRTAMAVGVVRLARCGQGVRPPGGA